MVKVLYVLLAASAIGVGVLWNCGCCNKNKVLVVPPEDAFWGSGNAKPDDESIKPFSINVSNKILDDLNNRLDQTRLSPPLEGISFQYGFNTNTLKKIINFWRHDYNWKERETYLNKYPQFKTQIQGLDIHYIHVKPKLTKDVKKSVPLLILHGWPGSVREFYELIPLLTEKPLNGADFVFEVIVPSLPGFGFSSAAAKPGLGVAQMAVLFSKLMSRLKHDKFYIQGGDWGSQIASHMGVFYPSRVLALHLNLCTVLNMKSTLLIALSSIWPNAIMGEKYAKILYPLSEKYSHLLLQTGYFHIQATKPDTVGVSVGDSPAGLAAYILEKFTSGDYSIEDGGLDEKFTYTNLLDNVMIYWITGTVTSSFRIYAESYSKEHRALKLETAVVPVPLWCSKFDKELGVQPDWILRLRYPHLRQSVEHDFGGHFAAFEVPKTLANDVWNAFIQAENVVKNEL